MERSSGIAKMEENFSIANKTRMRIPPLAFLALKNEILGKNYSLSIALVNEKTSQQINKTYRGKNCPTNVLSFPFSQKAGEIILCPAVIRREAKEKTKSPHRRSATETENFGKNWTELLGFLVIHALLHLKGLNHGKKMEKEEKKYLSRTKF